MVEIVLPRAVGGRGPQGPQGPQGPEGPPAQITEQAIVGALGFTPADAVDTAAKDGSNVEADAFRGAIGMFPTAPIDEYRTKALFSVAAKTLYCDPLTGDDAGPGTLAAPLKTLQEAVDRVPKRLYHRYIIDLRAAPAARGGLPVTYDEDVLIEGIVAQGTKESPIPVTTMLQINGAGSDPATNPSTDVRIGSMFVTGCTGVATPFLMGAHFLRKTPHYEQAACFAGFANTEFGGQNLSFAADVGVAGVRAYASGCVIKLTDFTNCTNAVWAKRNARVSTSDCVGVTSAAAYRVEENSVIQPIRSSVNEGLGGQRAVVFGGGQVIDQGGNIIRTSGSTAGIFMGWPADGAMKLSGGEGVGGYSIAFGYDFRCPSPESIVIGHNAEALGTLSVAIGSGAKSGAFPSNTVVGAGATTLSSRRAAAFGALAKAEYENSGAFGYNAVAPAGGVYKIGANAVAETDNGYRVAGLTVVGPRNTGWAAMTGTPIKTAIAASPAGTASAAYTQSELQSALNRVAALEARMKAYDDALRTHGLIGA